MGGWRVKELDAKIVRNNGHYERQSWHTWEPDAQGTEVDGLTGREIFQSRTFVKPVVIFEVHEVEDEFEFQYNPARNLP